MAKENQSKWSEYQGQLHEHMKSGNFGLATTAYKMFAGILLDEDRPDAALMNASVAAYIDVNGHCCMDLVDQGVLSYDLNEIWEPDGHVNINNLFPLAKAAKALELSEEEVGSHFQEGCLKLFPETFGAPLSYSDAWTVISKSQEWKDAWSWPCKRKN